MNTTTKIILIVVLLLGAGVGAYFLLKPKESSAGGHAGAGGSSSAPETNENAPLAGYSPSTTDNTPETGQTGKPTTSTFPYHIVGYEVRIMEGSADGTTLPFHRDTTHFDQQSGTIPVSGGMYNVTWILDMTPAGNGIEWKINVQGAVKLGKFLFKDMSDGKKASDWGYATIHGGPGLVALVPIRVTWQLTMWVE